MNPTPRPEAFLTRPIFVVILCLLAAGCASTPPVDWTSRIGHYTYEQAVAELGRPPDNSIRLPDGSLAADWITRRTSRTSVGLGVGTSSYRRGYGTSTGIGVGAPLGSYDRLLRLTFGPDGTLADWSKRNQ